MGCFFVWGHMDIATRQKICLAILRQGEEAAFAEYHVSDLDRAILRRCAHEIAHNAVRKSSPFKRYWKAPIRNPIRIGFVVSGCFAVASLGWAIRLFPFVDYGDPRTYPIATAAAALFAISAATSGWAFTSIVTARNARINHSLSIVSDRFSKSEFSTHASRFNAAFTGKYIDTVLITKMATSDDEKDRQAVQALRYLLNFFEYISVGVILGELDETIIRKTLRGNIVFYYDKCAKYIEEMQRINPLALEHLTMLRSHFRDI